jgi:hypothetical protein
MKENWEKPELIVLVKDRPEERVLLKNCKSADPATRSAEGDYTTCSKGNAGNCSDCDSYIQPGT